MDAQSAHFIFRDSLSDLSRKDDYIARIPAGITTREELFDVLSRELNFPSYFGANWDALWDCLCDLSWIDRRRVIVAHEAVPDLDEATLKVYLEELTRSAKDWGPDEEHELLVVFPEHAQARIRKVIGEHSREGDA